MGKASQYVVGLAVGGRRYFRTEEVVAAIGGSSSTVHASLRRMKARGEIAEPKRGFYVIVPPEHRSVRCIPADGFVPALMTTSGQPYYVTLLSAADLHGALRERPESFQVMSKGNRRTIVCGSVRVEFIARKDIEQTPVVDRITAHGPLRVASRAATALELVGYADRSGGLERVGSIVTELVESVDLDELVSEAARCPTAWVQRLGYLLDLGGCDEVADALVVQVRERARAVTRLVRSRSIAGVQRLPRWRLAINACIELEV